MEADVVVVGSGGAGLTAALAAACGGARVVVLERSQKLGGTTAVSIGSMWVPNNDREQAAGLADSDDEAIAYLAAVTLGRVSEELLRTFVGECGAMLQFVERQTGLAFELNPNNPDYVQHLPGAKPGGRTLEVGVFDGSGLGAGGHPVRGSGSEPPLTKLELDALRRATPGDRQFPTDGRRNAGTMALGRALVAGLVKGCLSHDVRFLRATRARGLLRSGDRITGVLADRAGTEHRLGARLGVVLASGGFEWDSALVRSFLGVPLRGRMSPSTNEGDGLRMAMAVGAALGNLGEAWWVPTLPILKRRDGEGRPIHRHVHVNDVRGLPGSIIVNREGLRFANEAMNYNDLGRALMHFDPLRYAYANLPCYLIFDESFRRQHAVAGIEPADSAPSWFVEAPTAGELAIRVGIAPDGLAGQLDEFNRHAARGVDPVFRRGESVHDRYRGDPRRLPHPNLRPLGPGPFYAIELELGCLGTKGGPITDTRGRVLGVDGRPIIGLFAAGNVAASPFGPGYPGAGATLSAGMTFGYLAGKEIGSQSRGE